MLPHFIVLGSAPISLTAIARKLRIEYPCAIYHFMHCGEGGEDICLDDQNRTGFLGTLGQACEKTAWQVHA